MNSISQDHKQQANDGLVCWRKCFRIQFFISNTSDSVGVLLNESYLFVCLAIFLEPAAHVRAALLCCMRTESRKKNSESEQHLYDIGHLQAIDRHMLVLCYSFFRQKSFVQNLFTCFGSNSVTITDHLPLKSEFKMK